MLVPEAFRPFLLTTGDMAIVVHRPEEVALAGSETLRISRADGQIFQIPFSAIVQIDPIQESP